MKRTLPSDAAKAAISNAAGGKRPYSAPVLKALDVGETRTGPGFFSQEIGTLYTPSS